MGEFKGTPGKWEAKLDGQIATSVYAGGKQIMLRCNVKEEAKYNALIMSKAPEMLELLQAFILAVPNDGTYNYQACMNKARDLIKEATEVDNEKR